MVFFILIDENALFLKYEYYPEGNKNLKPGIIKVDLISEKITVEEAAFQDKKITLPKLGADVLEAFVNTLKEEAGESPLSKEEWPEVHEDLDYYLYASAAMEKIAESLNDKKILREGSAHCDNFA